MKINWKVRLKNPIWWLTAIPVAVAMIYNILSLCGVVPKIAQDDVLAYATTLINALAALGVLVDPTTQGVSDSELAMTYDKPKPHDD